MSGSVFGATAGFLRGVGTQATVSVTASALAAVLIALASGMSLPFAGSTGAQGDGGKGSGWVSPVASDGKIRARHQEAGISDVPLRTASLSGLVSPAALLMPMALEWTQPRPEIASLRATAAGGETRPRALQAQVQVQGQAQTLPPRRPLVERAPAPTEAPLRITPAGLADADPGLNGQNPPRPPQPRLGVAMPAPVVRVGDAMSGAVGMVGAAGLWTLSRASALLPRL